MTFTSSLFRSRKSKGARSGLTGQIQTIDSPHGNKSGSRDRRSYGRIPDEGGLLKEKDEEKGIPMKETGVQVREVGSSGSGS